MHNQGSGVRWGSAFVLADRQASTARSPPSVCEVIMIDLTPFVPVILSVLVGVLIVFAVISWRLAVQWAKTSAVQAENDAYTQVMTIARVAVLAAEQMFDADGYNDKLNYVLKVLDRLYPDLDEDLIRAMVEVAVFQTKTKEAA